MTCCKQPRSHRILLKIMRFCSLSIRSILWFVICVTGVHLSGSSSHVLDCPICNSNNTELMPIATDESFRIEYSLTNGMETEFYKTNKVVIRQQSASEYEAQRSLSE